MKLLYLLLVYQKPSRPIRLVIVTIAEIVRGNMQLHEPELTIVYLGVGIAKRELAAFHRFHLGTLELDSAFQRFLHRVELPCFAIHTGAHTRSNQDWRTR